MSGNGKRKIPSWTAITIWTILFYPVGLFFLWKRKTSDKEAALNVGNSIIIYGFIAILIAILGMGSSVSTEDRDSTIRFVIFLLISGISTIVFGIIMKKRCEKYKRYITTIKIQGGISIDAIAKSMNISYDEAKNDIEKLIEKGYFTIKKEEKKETKVVTCESCGANNTIIIGKIIGCEFCGAPIS